MLPLPYSSAHNDEGNSEANASSVTCKKASSFPLRKEEDVALDEIKEDGDLKPKPNITGDELCRMFKPSLPSTTFKKECPKY